jgi:hypothetical protein
MKALLARLWSDLGTIVLALLMAFVIWILGTLEADPFQDKTYSNIPVTIVHQPPDTVLFDTTVEQVAVTVRMRQSVATELKASAFTATLNLSAVRPGVLVSVPISVTSSSNQVRIESVDPAVETIRLESVRTITLPVKIDVQGQVATGYGVAAPLADPDQVTLRGPAPLVEQVVAVQGLVSVTDAREDVVRTVSVVPVDAEGDTVTTGLEWSPNQVNVRVRVFRKVQYKPDVEVVPDLRGQPASGYRLGKPVVQPPRVTLEGPSSALEQIPFVYTEPISIAGGTESLAVQSFLIVPNGIRVVESDFVTVTVEILPILSGRTMTATVQLQGVPPGWIAVPRPSEVDLFLEGPESILSSLTAADVQVVLNLFGYSPGDYRVTPGVNVPEGVTNVSVIPETIEVVISVAPTPTPSTPITVTPGLVLTPTVTATP